jgi:hypothetical protein
MQTADIARPPCASCIEPQWQRDAGQPRRGKLARSRGVSGGRIQLDRFPRLADTALVDAENFDLAVAHNDNLT